MQSSIYKSINQHRLRPAGWSPMLRSVRPDPRAQLGGDGGSLEEKGEKAANYPKARAGRRPPTTQTEQQPVRRLTAPEP